MRLVSLILIVTALMLLGADAVTSLERGGELTVRSPRHDLGRHSSGQPGRFQELGAEPCRLHGAGGLFRAGAAGLGG